MKTPKENNKPQGSGEEQKDTGYSKNAAPSLSLPKGGGALKGIDEKFEVNAVNGTAGMSIPLPFSKGRSEFSPGLSLSYNSGTGNSEFGIGWNLSLPSIQRRTDKKLPTYDDANESDIFLFAGAEDLVPKLDINGDADVEDLYGFRIHTYIPRVEGLFARIQRIRPLSQLESYWKVTTRDNITTFFGLSENARIADPDAPERIFKWLPELAYDDKGNYHVFEYKKDEDLLNVPKHLHEKHRHKGLQNVTNTFLKKVSYGNLLPFYNDNIAGRNASFLPQHAFAPVLPTNPEFFFSTVFDYGEHDADNPTPDDTGDWLCRKDPFSNYKAGFEIRTYRLCKRVLCFHHFEELDPAQAGNVIPYLVHSLDLTYKFESSSEALLETDYIISAKQTAYRKNTSGGYDKRSLPPMDFVYQEPEWDSTVHSISDEDLVNAPIGLSANYQWMDFWNEGISGILTEQAEGWYYKSNLGDGHFSPAQKIAPKPSFTGLGRSTLQIQDLEADGKKYVVSTQKALQGFFELNDDDQWEDFQAFKTLPNINFNDPNTRFLDLDGDGMPDVLITQERVFTWYASKGKHGYDEARNTSHVLDEDKGPSIIFADSSQSIFLADISGDGLTDIVRIRNKDICYWPNLGYGRFGAKVTLSNAPLMDKPEQFNPAYIQLADVSGTGITDIIYLGKDQFRAWINLSGNAFSPVAKEITPFPNMEQPNNVQMVDLLGNGTSCIVWSSPMPRYANNPMLYIDLMASKKPYLLKSYKNNAGKEVSVEYKSSTKYYLADKAQGKAWISKLPFPVHCVAKTETKDVISGASYAQLYSYHHGYYDHAEREFRGFGCVETLNTENFTLPLAGAVSLDEPPVLSKTWYHTGFWIGEDKILNQYKKEYFNPQNYGGDPENDLVQPALDTSWTAIEQRQAVRALKGVPLRQEVYALDGSAQEEQPYSTSEINYKIQRLQERGENHYGVFIITEKEKISYNYERNAADPRIAHSLNTNIDELGHVLEQAAVVYPRKTAQQPTNLPIVKAEQEKTHIIYSQNQFSNDIKIGDGAYRLRLPYEAKQYELTGASPTANGYFDADDLKNDFAAATEIDYSAVATSGLEKRCVEAQRSQFLTDDLSTALAFGSIEALSFPHQQYRLAFTDNLLSTVYGSKVNASTMLLTEGKYIDLDNDNKYWIPSGTVSFSATPAADFYLPIGFTDPFANTSTVDYYQSPSGKKYFLLMQKTTDALGNESSIEAYDFRTLQALKLKDANDNQSVTAYDILGMPVGVAILGKGNDSSDTEADHLDNFVADLSNAEKDAFFADPVAEALGLLQGATARYIYDYESLPLQVATISREEHFVNNATPALQLAFEYSDGLGRVLMQKVQAEPGEYLEIIGGVLTTANSGTALRWVGTGRTILNNKSKPVQQYEPYFSGSHHYEQDSQLVEIGYTPTLYYDAIGRLIRTDMPNGTFSKVTFDAWMQKSYDANDTVDDSDWYSQRDSGALSSIAEEVDAKDKASAHYNSPSIVHTDSLARPFYTIQMPDQVPANNIHSYVQLDIESNTKKVIDGRGNEQLQYKQDMLGNTIYQNSIDGGERWMLNDVFGKPMYGWDSMNQITHNEYDELHRPTESFIDDGTTNRKIAEITYGESLGIITAKAENKRGQVIKTLDSAGESNVLLYDFKGQTLQSSLELIKSGTITDIDWNNPPAMSGEVFTTSIIYDALGRPLQHTDPGGNITQNSYNAAGLLESVLMNSTNYVSNINYNAKGQRDEIWYGNGTKTSYEYNERTYQLTRLLTTQGSTIYQDLHYYYDSVGNITTIRDDAQQTIYYNNSVVSPTQEFTYDALYRLIEGKGREQIGSSSFGNDDNYNDAPWMGIAHKGDGNAIQNYTQQYSYDQVGNITQLQHIAASNNYTRNYNYGTSNNRLQSTSIGSQNYTYSYDAHGNQLSFPHLSAVNWNALDQLSKIAKGSTEAYYQYDGSGQRIRKTVNKTGGIKEIRIYLGSYEIYRKYTGSTLDLERTTVHIADDMGRIAMYEERTQGTDNSPAQLTRYIYGNHLGSASLELDASAAIISYEEYHPYGTTSYQAKNSSINAIAKRYRFTGKERDEESGLYYHGARYYIPWLCRWCAVDPLEGKYAGWSSYNYSFNNPIMFNDPSGMGPGDEEKKQGIWYLDYNSYKFSTAYKTEEEFNNSEFGKNPDRYKFLFTKDETKYKNQDGDEVIDGYTEFGVHYNWNTNTGNRFETDWSGEYPISREVNAPKHKEEKAVESKATKIISNIGSGGIGQELKSTVLKKFSKGIESSKSVSFSISLRDNWYLKKTGHPSSSHVFLKRIQPEYSPQKWKGVRFDFGKNTNTGGAINWHWNNEGVKEVNFKTGRISDHALLSKSERYFAIFSKNWKVIGRGLWILGAATDSYSLGTEINKSYNTGNWSNTGNEASRIAGGWGGAYIMSQGLATTFATWGAFGGPLGIGIGFVAGGILGGILGYTGGGWLGQKIFNLFN